MSAGSDAAASGTGMMSSGRKGICSSAQRVAAKSVAARNTATDNRRHFIVSAVVPLTLTTCKGPRRRRSGGPMGCTERCLRQQQCLSPYLNTLARFEDPEIFPFSWIPNFVSAMSCPPGDGKFLARPTLSATSLASLAPLAVSIEPVVLFSILDHALRRSANQRRVIGTMLGIRSDDGTEVEVRNCFAVPHNESSEQVTTALKEARLTGIG